MTTLSANVHFWGNYSFKTLTFCELFLTAEVELWAGAEWVNDVDNEAMRWCSEWQRASGHQQSDDMEQVGQMSSHVQRVVEGEHEHVTGQDSDVVPHQVLLKGGVGDRHVLSMILHIRPITWEILIKDFLVTLQIWALFDFN